tara:strand:- start:416 stop:925 length:510 start_codon:yes stop_codon:yes gene_type:complete
MTPSNKILSIIMIRQSNKLYYPDNKGIKLFVEQNKINTFWVDFETESCKFNNLLHRLYEIVIFQIANMTEEEQEREASRFFFFLLDDNVREDIGNYLNPLLEYWKSIGYLKFKKNVYNKMNQSIVRYVIDYKDVDGNIVISKKYSSIKQVSCDIGSGKSSSVYYIVKKL